MKTPAEALAEAKRLCESGDASWNGKCLGCVRHDFDGNYTYGSASENFHAIPDSRKRQSWPPPAGFPLWWLGGGHGYGHVAISAGGGFCYSTDFTDGGYVGDGRVHLCHINSISAHDGALSYQGWTTQIEDEALPEPAAVHEKEWTITDPVEDKVVGYGVIEPGHSYSAGIRHRPTHDEWFVTDKHDHNVVGFGEAVRGRHYKFGTRTVRVA